MDCLVDSRLACIIYVNPDLALELVKKGYTNRLHNTLSKIHPLINDDVIDNIWKNRDISILKNAKRSMMTDLLGDYISQSNNNPQHPQSLDYRIVVNTYPYDLSREQLIEYFNCFSILLNTKNISRVHLPPKEITPSYLKEKVNRFICHDFDEWLGCHKDILINNPIPFVTIAVPFCLVKGKEDDKIDEDQIIKTSTASFSSIFDLEFFPLRDLSPSIPLELRKNNVK